MTATLGVALYQGTDFTTDSAATYKAKIDANFQVLTRVSSFFAPSAESTPSLRIAVGQGALSGATAVTEYASRFSAYTTTPSTNPRIDVVSMSQAGTINLTVGTEAVSPVTPAFPSGDFPIATIRISPGQTAITNSMITDIRTGFAPALSAGTGVTISGSTISSTSGKLLRVVQFTSSGTYTPTADAVSVEFELVGAGGGGGGGGGLAFGGGDSGGAGGGAGGSMVITPRFRLSDLAATMAVVIGTGGPGGTTTVATVAGTAGTAGGSTTITINTGQVLTALGGNGGSLGNASGGAGGTSNTTNGLPFVNCPGGAGGTDIPGSSPTPANYCTGPGGGGGGGGGTNISATTTGGTGTLAQKFAFFTGSTAGGGAGGASGTNPGTAGASSSTNYSTYGSGGGGGGGASTSTLKAGGAGGAGGAPGGGGGGGGGANGSGFAGGVGGVGGRGEVRIYEYGI